MLLSNQKIKRMSQYLTRYKPWGMSPLGSKAAPLVMDRQNERSEVLLDHLIVGGTNVKQIFDKREKILPINKAPLIRTYSYYGFLNAILSSETYLNRIVASIIVEDYKLSTWKNEMENLSIEYDNNILKFVGNDCFLRMNGCIYRRLLKEDKIHIIIQSQIISQPWGAINVFISDLQHEEMLEDDSYICRLGLFSHDGVYVRTYNKQKTTKKIGFSLPMHLIIEHHNGEVLFLAKTLDTEPVVVWKEKLQNLNYSNMSIGVQVKLNESAYLNWLYSNYIQLSCDVDNKDVKLQYHFGLKKNWQYYISNYFVDYIVKDFTELSDWKIGKLDYIKYCIDKSKYVEVWNNQFFVKGRKEYHKENHFHQNLIYGYSDVSMELYILGYTNNGLMAEDSISYEDFLNEKNVCREHNMLIEYCMKIDGTQYLMDVEYMKLMIEQYIKGTNSSIYYHHLLPHDSKKYGINIYDELMKKQGLRSLLYDRRVAHLIYEHKVCMNERLMYLEKKKIITGIQAQDLMEQLAVLIDASKKLRNVSLKYSMGERTQKKYDDLKQRLIDLKKWDMEFMKNFYQALVEVKNGKDE